jgi:dTDP-glucose pyrophosphorylase
VADEGGRVEEIQVKQPNARSNWIWGAFRLSGRAFHELHQLWREPGRGDEYIGTLVNAWLRRGGTATAVRTGTAYVDVGTVRGYREAMNLLSTPARSADTLTVDRHQQT